MKETIIREKLEITYLVLKELLNGAKNKTTIVYGVKIGYHQANDALRLLSDKKLIDSNHVITPKGIAMIKAYERLQEIMNGS